MTEKRSYRRYKIWFPVTLHVGEEQIWSICRDASSGGVFVSAVRPIEEGTLVDAEFAVRPETAAKRIVRGTVVRLELNRDALVLAFPHRIAVEFREIVPELIEELAAVGTSKGVKT